MVSLCMIIYDIRDEIVKKQAVSSCNKSGLPESPELFYAPKIKCSVRR